MKKVIVTASIFLAACSIGSAPPSAGIIPADWKWEDCAQVRKDCDISFPLPTEASLDTEGGTDIDYFWVTIKPGTSVHVQDMPMYKTTGFKKMAGCDDGSCLDYSVDRGEYILARRTIEKDQYEFYVQTPEHVYRVFSSDNPPKLLNAELKILETSLMNLRIAQKIPKIHDIMKECEARVRAGLSCE